MKQDWDSIPEALHPFVSLGCEFNGRTGDEWVGTAPFSEKENKLYVNSKTGLFDEKHLGLSGNRDGFLEAAAKHFEAEMTPRLRERLAKSRRLPVEALAKGRIGWDGDSYTVPVLSRDGRVKNILRYRIGQRAMGLKGVPAQAHLADLGAAPSAARVWYCEGPWDGFALRWLHRAAGSKDAVCWVPGAEVFSENCARGAKGRECILSFDNDAAGERGAAKAHAKLRQAGSKPKHLHWDRDWEPGLDLNDFVSHGRELGVSPAKMLAALKTRIRPEPRGDHSADTAGERERFPIVEAEEVLNSPPLEWLVEHRMPCGALVVLFGEPECGKSLVALGLAHAVSNGVPFIGQAVKRGLVLYIAGEGRQGQGARLRAVRSGFRHAGFETDFAKLAYVLTSPQLTDDSDVDALVNAWQRRFDEPPVLVILDTLSRAMSNGADENSSKDMAQAIANADRLAERFKGCARIILHHTTKGTGTERGSTVLRGASDVMIRVSRPQKGDRIVLTCEKMKDAEHFEPVRLRMRTVLYKDGSTGVYLAPDERAQADGERLGRGAAALLRLLEKRGREDWMSRAQLAQAANSNGTDGAFKRALEKLEQTGRVERRRDGKTTLFRLKPNAGPGPGNAGLKAHVSGGPVRGPSRALPLRGGRGRPVSAARVRVRRRGSKP